MTAQGSRNGDRTRQVFAFVKQHVENHGDYPASSDVAAHMGWKSIAGVSDAYTRLVCWGWMTRHTSRPCPDKGRRHRFEYRLAITQKSVALAKYDSPA